MGRRLAPFLWLAAASLAACDGQLGDAPPLDLPERSAEGASCAGVRPGPSPLRRMTRFEYDRTVRDLLGDDSAPATSFAPDEEALGFDDQAAALGVSPLLAEQYQQAAEKLAAKAITNLPKLVDWCAPEVTGEEACGQHFIESFGRRAYRRPLDGGEKMRLLELFVWGRNAYGFATGIQLVLEAMLESPSFLYRVEFGSPNPVPGQPDVVPLTSHELASRLSYLLWASMPDDELFALADSGALQDPQVLEKQARRMLDDPRAREAVSNFHAQWLELGRLATMTKDPATYPAWSDGVRDLLREEAERTTARVVLDQDGDVAALLTSPEAMMNADLAAYYGVEGGPAGAAFEPVTLAPERRGGILRLGAVLAAHAKPNQSSPVHRGKFVRERLLCQPLPPPPAGLAITAPDVDPHATTREAFAEHAADPVCATCHDLMDPIGFGFERYDGIGRHRDTDHGLPIDATGDLADTSDANGPFDGLPELAAKLAASEDVRRCVVTQWFRFGHGRPESEEDRCTLQRLQTVFAASGYRVRDLLVALTQTDAFRYRRKLEP